MNLRERAEKLYQELAGAPVDVPLIERAMLETALREYGDERENEALEKAAIEMHPMLRSMISRGVGGRL